MKRPLAAFLLVCAGGAALGCLPALLEAAPEGALVSLLALYQFALLPLAALLLPAFAGAWGVPPIAAFFPPGLFYALLLPRFSLRPSVGVTLVLFALGIFGACAGQEWKRRADKRRR